jgi:hypothetical protein
MIVVFIRKNYIRMVFVYFAFWGLQEKFSIGSAPDAAMILGLFSQKKS